MNILFVLSNLRALRMINQNYTNYAYKTNHSKLINIDTLDCKLFEYIDVVVINVHKLVPDIEHLINNNNNVNKQIYVFSNIKLNITNDKCTFVNSIKLNDIYKYLNKINNIEDNIVDNEQKPVESASNIVSNTLSHNDIATRQPTERCINKVEYRNFLCEKMKDIYEYALPTIKINNLYEAVFVEYRILPHLELLLRNCIYRLGEKWSHTIICGNINYEYMSNIVKQIDRQIKIVNTNDFNMTQNDYNNMLLTTEFWKNLVGEKILIYQEDTFVFKHNIEDFIGWDYIGAPFKHDCVEGINVGNGGFSLRSKSKMIEILNKVDLNTICMTDFKTCVQKYKIKAGLSNIPEDIYFTTYLQKYNVGCVADENSAKLFSSDTIYCENSFGMHCMWNGCKDWKESFFKKQTVYIITPDQGGGTSKYINMLISIYNDKVNFIKCNKKSQLLNFKFKQCDIFFVNHFFYTDIEISDIITIKNKYNMKCIVPIHDMYYLGNTLWRDFNHSNTPWHTSYLEENKISNDNLLLFKNSDLIIHFTKFTYDIFSKYFDNSKFVIYEHIDLKYDKYNIPYCPKIVEKCINIGNLSVLSEYKGKEAVVFLFNNVTYYKNYKICYFVVELNINKYDELDFFNIIKDNNIHGLLHLNKYGETWSYSLTKSLASRLPIFYNNIGSYKTRVNKHYHVVNIENENNYYDFNKLKQNFYTFLDKIIECSSYNKLSEPLTYELSNDSHSMYDFLFDNNINKHNFNFLADNIKTTPINCENIVLITSKIVTSNVDYTYISNRSIYTTDERYQQLLATIASVKKYIPNSYIILIDNSKLNDSMTMSLNKSVNLFVNDNENDYLNYFTDKLIYKGYGELAQMLYVFNNYLLKPNVMFKNFFKISGRYVLIDDVTEIILANDNVFKKNNDVLDREYYYTCFYKIINYKFMDYYKSLLNMYTNKFYYGKDMECIIPYELNYNFFKVEKLNLQQNISVWNDKSII